MTATARCRSCQAPIEWATSVKGKRMPLDAAPVKGGNITLTEDGVAVVVAAGDGNRVSHFATCSAAARHRRRSRGSA